MEIMSSQAYHENCLDGIKNIESNSIDCILTDPPYGYIKHRLDIPFDEDAFFNECKRVLKKDGFIVLFGRGTSFYRWNMMLANRGLKFKEEVIWNKMQGTSPVAKMMRIHETISLHTVSGKINKIRVPYLEQRQYDFNNLVMDVNRIKSALNNTTQLNDILNYLQNGIKKIKEKGSSGITVSGTSGKGAIRHVAQFVLMKEGFIEKSIITENRNHYYAIHPTQKPVPLLQRLLKITVKKGDIVLDPFMGSGSTRIAAYNEQCSFIGFEIDKEFFDAANKRYHNHISEQIIKQQ
jgi:site-specific DNA-methyltransferase (adenine-specific)